MTHEGHGKHEEKLRRATNAIDLIDAYGKQKSA